MSGSDTRSTKSPRACVNDSWIIVGYTKRARGSWEMGLYSRTAAASTGAGAGAGASASIVSVAAVTAAATLTVTVTPLTVVIIPLTAGIIPLAAVITPSTAAVAIWTAATLAIVGMTVARSSVSANFGGVHRGERPSRFHRSDFMRKTILRLMYDTDFRYVSNIQ